MSVQMSQVCACLLHFARRLLRYRSLHEHGPSVIFFFFSQASDSEAVSRVGTASRLPCLFLLQRYLPMPAGRCDRTFLERYLRPARCIFPRAGFFTEHLLDKIADVVQHDIVASVTFVASFANLYCLVSCFIQICCGSL